MGTEAHTSTAAQSVGIGELARRGGLALAIALVVNLLVVTVADAVGIAPNLDPLSYGPVALFTTVGIVGATLVYGLVSRFTSDPNRTFTVVAVVVLLLSLVPDATFVPGLPGATTVGAATLALMHVTATVAAVAALTGRVDV